MSGYGDAVRLGAHWLVTQQRDDGSIGPQEELSAFRKLPAALLVGGQPTAAGRFTRWLVGTRLDDGRITTGPDDVESHDMYVYAASWVAWGLLMEGRLDVAERVSAALLPLQGSSGGFQSAWATEATTGAPQDVWISALTGIVLLHTRRLAAAERVGRFLIMALEQQPDPRRLYLVVQDGRLATTYDPAAAARYVIDPAKGRQYFFAAGLPAAFLGLLYRMTGQDEYLEAARRFIDFVVTCPELYRWPENGKVGWGAAVLWDITRDERFRAIAREVAQFLLDTQAASGAWERPNYGLMVDVTAEFTFLLAQIARHGV